MIAEVVRGRKTNRVVVKRRADPSPQRALRRYRKDPLTRGLDYTTVCVSLPVEELAALDIVCARVQMARSHFIRQAVKHFAAQIGVWPPTTPKRNP